MAASLTQLTGGSFQDANGNVLAFGYLTLKLSQDGNVSGVGNICSGVAITIQLDANGNVGSSTSPTPVANQYVWANSNIAPINTYYKVTGFTQQGERAFGLNNQQVAAGATFNVGTWVPNSVISWFPEVSQNSDITLEVNGVPNSSQTLLNLEAGTNITITDEGNGNIQVAASGSSGFPAGSNMCVLPAYQHASGGLNGYTVVLHIPASYITAFTSGLKVGVLTTSATGLVLNAASVGKTLPGGTAWTSGPVALTFPAGAFASASTLYFSNECAIAGDASHDYYIMLYWDLSSSTGSAYATEGTAVSSALTAAAFLYSDQLAGYISGNHTADTDASALQTLSGSSIFCIQQVLTA